MMRSASTWSFNVCRLLGILLANHFKVPSGSAYLNPNELDIFLKTRMKTEPGYVVIKAHSLGEFALELIKNNEIKNVSTIRDPRDCVASRQLFEEETFEQSVHWIKNSLFYVHLYQQTKNTLFIRYEEMIRNPAFQIKEICSFLDVELSDKHLLEINEQTSMINAQRISNSIKTRPIHELLRDRSHVVDPTTQIHENHIHGGICGRWKTELSIIQQKAVIAELKPWLISLGYETEDSMKIFH